MKKIILIILLLAAVFTVAFAGCGQGESSEKAGFGAAFNTAFDDCQTAEDYINAAKKCIESNDIYTANEAIKAGYRATKDPSLRLVVVNGKPTVESSVILHRIFWRTLSFPSANSMQYFLGRDVVLGRSVVDLPPLWSGSTVPFLPPAFIYSFHPQTHRLQAIEVSSYLSYDKLDTDLLNIAISSNFSSSASLNIEQAAEEAYCRETAPLNVTYRFEYDADGALCALRCGAIEAEIIKTATGYQLTMPNDPIEASYLSPGKLELTIDLQNDKIVKLTDSQACKTESFSYGNDGTYTVTAGVKTEHNEESNATVTFNNDYLPVQAQSDGKTWSYTYNDNQTLSQIKEIGDEEKTYTFSYDDLGRLQSLSDSKSSCVFLYDEKDGRMIKISLDSDSLPVPYYDDKGRFAGFEKQSSFNYSDSDGRLTSFCLLDDSGNIKMRGNVEMRYNIVRDDDGFVFGLTNPGAKFVKASDLPLYPGFGNLDDRLIHISGSSDEEMWLQVGGATRETYDTYKASAIEAGCTEIQQDNNDNENTDITWLIDTVDDPARTIKLEYWDSASILHIKVRLGTDKWFEH